MFSIKKNMGKLAVLIALVLTLLAALPVSAANFTTWNSQTSGTLNDLNAVWGTADNDVFAVGNSGTILHYNGTTWSSMTSGTIVDLYSIWGNAANDVYAAGKAGTILHYNGTTWAAITSGSTADLNALRGFSASDIFAAGSAGTILHFDGSKWNSQTSGTTNELHALWGAISTAVFAAGKSGMILYYDGSKWNSQSSGTTRDLRGLWGSASSDVFAAGSSGTILRYNGTVWSSITSGITGDIFGIWGTTASDVFAVGVSGTIAHYDGSNWVSMNRDTLNEQHAVWGLTSADVFSAGAGGSILRYLPPSLTAVSPSLGTQGSVMDISITGASLAAANNIGFGPGIAVNKFTVNNSTQISANITISSSAAVGSRDVTVATPGGTFTLAGSFSVKQALPTIISLSPEQNRQAATLDVSINGTNLGGASQVQFGSGISVNNFTVISSNQISANITIAADAATGTRDISVTVPGGSFTLPAGFSVKQALPTLTSLSPNNGNQETTLTITLSGTYLTGTTEVQMGNGIAINSFNVLSSGQLSANISIISGATTGSRDVAVTTPGGSFTLPNGFTVKQALPVITSISPDHGGQGATLTVTITGKNFNGAANLNFGDGIVVNSFSVLNVNQISAKISLVAGIETGTRDISISTPGGNYTLNSGFSVQQALPVIASVSPSQGSLGKMLQVIISGSSLSGVTDINFGNGIDVKNFANLSPTQISATIDIEDSAATGLRDVSVTTPGGSSTLASGFEVKARSLGALYFVFIWVGVAVVVALFVVILYLLRKKRTSRI
jgi:hypothetical protein